MAIKDKSYLKNFFETGDIPNEAEFKDLIDRCYGSDLAFVMLGEASFDSESGTLTLPDCLIATSEGVKKTIVGVETNVYLSDTTLLYVDFDISSGGTSVLVSKRIITDTYFETPPDDNSVRYIIGIGHQNSGTYYFGSPYIKVGSSLSNVGTGQNLYRQHAFFGLRYISEALDWGLSNHNEAIAISQVVNTVFNGYKGYALKVNTAGATGNNFYFRVPLTEGITGFDYELFSTGAITVTVRIFSTTSGAALTEIAVEDNIAVNGYYKGFITGELAASAKYSELRFYVGALDVESLYIGRIYASNHSESSGSLNGIDGIVPAPKVPVERLLNYNGQHYGEVPTIYLTGATHDYVDAPSQLGYDGKAIHVTQQAIGNFEYKIDESLLNDGIAVEAVMELYSPVDFQVRIRCYENRGTATLKTTTAFFVKGGQAVTRTVQFGVIDKTDLTDISIRFFDDFSESMNNIDLYIGRVCLIEGLSDIVSLNWIEQSIGSYRPKLEALIKKEDFSILKTNLTGNNRWIYGLHTSVGNRYDGWRFLPQVVGGVDFSLIDALVDFGYSGNAVLAERENNGNFMYQMNPKRFVNDPTYKATGKVSVTLELISVSVGQSLLVVLYKSAASEVVVASQTLTVVAGEVMTYNFGGTVDLSDANSLNVRIFPNAANLDGSFKIGRINAYGGAPLNVLDFYQDILGVSGVRTMQLELQKPKLVFWGDSMTTRNLHNLVSANLEREGIDKGIGGDKSTHIRDRFFLEPELHEFPCVIWSGRNNNSGEAIVESVLSDIHEMVEALPHSNFLIMSPQNGSGEYTGSAKHTAFTTIAQELQKRYGHNFIDNRRGMITSWHYGGVKLTNSFTQPSISSNVQVTVSDTSIFASSDTIRIGFFESADKYTVFSIDSATQMTVTLTESNRITPAATVGNISSTNQGTTSLQYLRIISDIDFLDRNGDTIAESMREDGVHLTVEADQFLADMISERIDSLGI